MKLLQNSYAHFRIIISVLALFEGTLYSKRKLVEKNDINNNPSTKNLWRSLKTNLNFYEHKNSKATAETFACVTDVLIVLI